MHGTFVKITRLLSYNNGYLSAEHFDLIFHVKRCLKIRQILPSPWSRLLVLFNCSEQGGWINSDEYTRKHLIQVYFPGGQNVPNAGDLST